MVTIHTVLIVVALGCFALATFGVAAKVNLVAAGLFAWLLAATFVQ